MNEVWAWFWISAALLGVYVVAMLPHWKNHPACKPEHLDIWA